MLNAIEPQPSRRRFLRSLTTAAAALTTCNSLRQAFGIDPFSRLTPSRMRLSLAAYSLRDYLKGNKDGWDLFQFVDYCHEQAIDGAEITSYYFPSELSDSYIIDLKEHCHRRGITVSGGAIANDFCQSDDSKRKRDMDSAMLWIDRYALLGANVIRVFAGNQPKGESWEQTRDRCVDCLETVAKYAHTKGIYLGLENHGGVTAKAEGLLQIVKQVNAPSFGVNLDSGNFLSTDNPYQELSEIAPYAVNAQIKVEMFPNGKKELADLDRILKILSDAKYSGWVALEYEASEPPLESIPLWLSKLKKSLASLTS